jgi:hypothetical protein
MSKEELVKEFRSRFVFDPPAEPHSSGGTLLRPYEIRGSVADVENWLSSALDRYALSVVEASVPEEKNHHIFAYGKCELGECAGFNSCRSHTLQNAKKLLNVGGETNPTPA